MDIGGALAGGVVIIVLYLAFSAGAIALGIWITYEVIWRAVRRGLREYNGTMPGKNRHGGGGYPAGGAMFNQRGPRDW